MTMFMGLILREDTYLNPTGNGGGFYYPRSDDLGSDGCTTARADTQGVQHDRR